MLLPVCFLILHKFIYYSKECMVESFHLTITLCMIHSHMAFLDPKCSTQLLHQSGGAVCTAVAQQLSRHAKYQYEPLIQHFGDGLCNLVSCHHCQCISHEVSVMTRMFLMQCGLFSSIIHSTLVKSTWTSSSGVCALIGHMGL